MNSLNRTVIGATLLMLGSATLAIGQTGSGAMAGSMSPATSAEGFVTAAAMSDMYEIQAGTIASTKAGTLEIKNFAQQMIQGHTQTSMQLKKIAAANNMTPPMRLDARHQAMIDQLRGAGKQDFDRTYVSQQVAAHQEALSLMQQYAADGEQPALKQFAAKTAPVVQQHLTMARNLKTS